MVVLSLRSGQALDAAALLLLTNSVGTTLLMNSIFLPLMYRFGSEKARMIYVMMFAGFGALLAGAADWLQNTPLWMAAAMLAVVLAVYAASWRLSVAWYGKYKK